MWTCHNRPQVEVSPGFLLLLGVLFWLDDGIGLLPWGLLACLLHELGHITVAAALGGQVDGLSLTVVGAELRIRYDAPLNYAQDGLVALAGPTANLLAGGLFTAQSCHWTGGGWCTDYWQIVWTQIGRNG